VHHKRYLQFGDQHFAPDEWERQGALKVAAVEGYENPILANGLVTKLQTDVGDIALKMNNLNGCYELSIEGWKFNCK
jgi:hypothetical protein